MIPTRPVYYIHYYIINILFIFCLFNTLFISSPSLPFLFFAYNFFCLTLFGSQNNGKASLAKPLRSLKSTIRKSRSGSVHICFSSSSNSLMSRFTPAPMVITRTPRDFNTSDCLRATRRSCALPSVKTSKIFSTPGRSPFEGSPLKT